MPRRESQQDRRILLESIVDAALWDLFVASGAYSYFEPRIDRAVDGADWRVTHRSAAEIASLTTALYRAINAATFEKWPHASAEALPKGRGSKAADPAFREWLKGLKGPRG